MYINRLYICLILYINWLSQTNSYITTCTKHICSWFSGDLADIIKIAYGHGKEQNCIDLSFSDVAYPKVIVYNTNEDEVEKLTAG